jgi:hypothetical protein
MQLKYEVQNYHQFCRLLKMTLRGMFAERRLNSPLSKPHDISGEEAQAILQRLCKIAVAKQTFPEVPFSTGASHLTLE